MRHVKPVSVAKANAEKLNGWNTFWVGFGHSWQEAWGKNDNGK